MYWDSNPITYFSIKSRTEGHLCTEFPVIHLRQSGKDRSSLRYVTTGPGPLHTLLEVPSKPLQRKRSFKVWVIRK